MYGWRSFLVVMLTFGVSFFEGALDEMEYLLQILVAWSCESYI